MGSSLTTKLVYGRLLPLDEYGEPQELPWDTDDEDAEGWWDQLTGFQPTSDPYQDGTYKTDPEAVDRYHQEKRDWRAEHPCPIDIEYAGVQDWWYPAVIRPSINTCLATFYNAATTLEPDALHQPAELDDATKATIDALIEEHDINAGPWGWHITATYG